MNGEVDARARLVRGAATGGCASVDAGERAGGGRRARHRLALGWEPPANLDRAAWLAAGASLAEFGRVNNWWVGDWIRCGNARWGAKYVEAARITGLDGKTLRNIAYVAKQFDLSRRRDNLTWTHHAEVAALTPEQQDEWLDRAVVLRLSPGDLRLEVRASQRTLTSETDEGAAVESTDHFSCPHCGAAIALSELRSSSLPS
jgi:hypothetical protein